MGYRLKAQLLRCMHISTKGLAATQTHTRAVPSVVLPQSSQVLPSLLRGEIGFYIDNLHFYHRCREQHQARPLSFFFFPLLVLENGTFLSQT